MLVIVISLFAVCWAPVLIDNVLAAFEVVDKYNYGAIKHMRQAFSLMSYANSCVNPMVYAFMSKNFRDSFKAAMCACAPERWRSEPRWSKHGRSTGSHVTVDFRKPRSQENGSTSSPNNGYRINNRMTTSTTDTIPEEVLDSCGEIEREAVRKNLLDSEVEVSV